MISVVWGDVRNYEDSGGHRAAFQAYAVIVSSAVANVPQQRQLGGEKVYFDLQLKVGKLKWQEPRTAGI